MAASNVTQEHIDYLLSSLSNKGHNAAPLPDVISGKHGELSSAAFKSSRFGLLDLPYDLLAIILEHVPPYEIPRMRRVSRAFNEFLTADHVLSPLLRHHFPYHVRSSLRGGVQSKAVVGSIEPVEGEATVEELVADDAADVENTAETQGEDQGIAGASKAFDLALKRFFNRSKGKPSSITVINGVRPDTCYETETSYDHMFLVFHHTSGKVFIYDSGNRFPQHPYVTLDIRSLGVPWHGVKIHRRSVRQSVVLDKRILIVSGTKEFDNDPERRIPQAVYSLHNYPEIELVGVWRGVQYHERMHNLCANDEWIGCRVNRHSIKLIRIDSLRSNRDILPDGTYEQGPSPNPVELTFHHPTKGFIKDVHLSKYHVFVYSVVVDENDLHGHGQVDVFRIDPIPDDTRTKPRYEIAHVRSMMLHSWQGMFMDYIGYQNPDEVPPSLRCQRWDKIYPHMRGNRFDGMPEEDEESVMMTLGKTFRANGNVPIGCVRIHAEPETVQMGPPVLETIAPHNIIPFCVALEHTIQEEDADHTLLLPASREAQSRAEMENEVLEYVEPNPFDPDIPAPPDHVEMTTGDHQDPQPGDDAAYILHFQNGTAAAEASKRAEPMLPTPTIREAWYLEQDQTQRSSVITEEGLFHIFYDEPQPEAAALNLVTPNPPGQNLTDPIRLFPSHLQHITLEEIFDETIPFYEIDLPEEDGEEDGDEEMPQAGEEVPGGEWGEASAGSSAEASAEEGTASQAELTQEQQQLITKLKMERLMASIRHNGNWSCYVWSAETWNGFLIATPHEAKMVILRYD